MGLVTSLTILSTDVLFSDRLYDVLSKLMEGLFGCFSSRCCRSRNEGTHLLIIRLSLPKISILLGSSFYSDSIGN